MMFEAARGMLLTFLLAPSGYAPVIYTLWLRQLCASREVLALAKLIALLSRLRRDIVVAAARNA